MNSELTIDREKNLFNWALALAVLTVVYNLTEGMISVYFGFKHETLTLFGFGVDSFIETISALGITQMVLRIRRNPGSSRGPFEIRALRITGWCFYTLALFLTVTAVFLIIEGSQPVSTVAGVIIGGISIFTMWALIWAKIKMGRKLGSAPIIADARCNLVCLYMSVLLLVASGIWWLWQIPYIDAAGSLGLVYFSVKEGREAFEKAKGIECCD